MRKRTTQIALLAALATLFAATPASAEHAIEKTIGSTAPGTTGGLFDNPADIAVRHSTGQIYVADSTNNRIQRFDQDGNFELAFGRDVIKPGAPGDLGDAFEICAVVADCKAGSTGSAADGPGGELGRPVGIGIRQTTGQLYVRDGQTGNPRTSIFDADGVWQRSFGWGVVKAGGAGDQPGANERQLVTVSPFIDEPFRLSFSGQATVDIALDASAANVQSALEALSNLAPGDVAVSGPAGGPWTVDFLGGGAYAGLDVPTAFFSAPTSVAFRGTVTTPIQGGAYEVCTVAADCLSGTAGIAAGQLATPPAGIVAGVAVEPASGDVYVADPGTGGNSNARINHYAASGAFIRAFGWGVDSGAEQFEICTAASACGEAVTPPGDVNQPANGQFFQGRPSDIAIDPTSGILYAAQGTGDRTHAFRFDTTKATAGQFLLPLTLTTVDPPQEWVEGGWPVGNLDSKQPIGLEVDPGSGHLLLFGGDATISVQEIDPALAPATVLERHAQEGSVGGLAGQLLGFGHDPTSDTLYASTQTSGNGGHRLLFFSTTPAPAITASTGAATGIDKRSATLSGTVDPNGPAGIETRYRFEYRKDSEAEWIKLHANDENLGDGTSPVAVSQDFNETQLVSFAGSSAPTGGTFTLTFSGATTTPIPFDASAATVDATLEALSTVGADNVAVTGSAAGPWKVSFTGALGLANQAQLFGSGSGLSPFQNVSITTLVNGTPLEANTAYRFRIRAYKPFGQGGDVLSNETTFTTAAAPPDIETLYPQSRGDDTARLAGLINPNSSPTDYRFEYGETLAYGNSAPVPDGVVAGGKEQLVLTEVEGLAPNTTYHYRLVADNGTEEAPGDTTIEGEDVVFTTRATVAPDPKRSFEMVTPPFKVTRSTVAAFSSPGYNANPGLPSLDGESIRWDLFYFPLFDDSGFPFDGERLITRRTPQGWVTEPLMTLSPLPQYKAFQRDVVIFAHSGDLETQAWTIGDVDKPIAILPNEGTGPLLNYTRKDGTGSEGWSGWLDNVDTQEVANSSGDPLGDLALVNDDGSAMARWGGYRGLADDPETTADEDPSDNLQLPGANGGKTPYLQLNPPLGAKDLISECTGTAVIETQTLTSTATGGTYTLTLNGQTSGTLTPSSGAGAVKGRLENAPISLGAGNVEVVKAGPVWTITFVGDLAGANIPQLVANTGSLTGGTVSVATLQDGGFDGNQTLIPSRSDNGTPGNSTDDTIASRDCGEGSIVSRRGAIMGAKLTQVSNSGESVASGAAATALADTGKRVFFTAPDPLATGASLSSCQSATGAATNCPPQLFVRSYDESGDPKVRWVSKPATGMPTQAISLLGAAVFEGASRDGSVVYFKSNTPLTPDDPNATGTPGPKSGGNASEDSWDLYRYELPVSPEDDPAAGTLTRVSGGPASNADPNTNPSGGKGAAARFVSDDGGRAYFVTGAPISGADTTPPQNGVTVPGGGVSNNGTRNLYLFDDNGASPEWRFLAQIPFAADADGTDAYNACASFEAQSGFQIEQTRAQRSVQGGRSCVRGTPDGSAITFVTQGRLTQDDRDDSADVYLYDAREDELTRLSAPPPGVEGYPCEEAGIPLLDPPPYEVEVACNAELGFNGGQFGKAGNYDTLRGWGGGRYLNMTQEASGAISAIFQSLLPLLPEDQNAEWDVYRWREGELELLSRGKEGKHSHYSGSSLDGEDIFIQTSDRIDPRELDDADYDLYDLRIGDGFPYTPPPVPCDVLALDCEAQATNPPLAPEHSTANPTKGNVPPPPAKRCAKGKVRRKGRCVTKRKARKQRAANKNKKGGRR